VGSTLSAQHKQDPFFIPFNTASTSSPGMHVSIHFFVLLQLQFLLFFKILNEKESAHPILAISVSPIMRVAVHC
jgi:hypothetical protein